MNSSGVWEEIFDEESGPQNAGPALPSAISVALGRSFYFSGFHQGAGHRILRELSLLIAKDSKVTYFRFFDIVSTSNGVSFTLLSGRKELIE